MQTCPPEKKNFTGLVNQWVIYDRYMRYEAGKEKAEELELNKEKEKVKLTRRRLTNEEEESEKEILRKQMMRSIRILERMVNQNNHDEITLGTILFSI